MIDPQHPDLDALVKIELFQEREVRKLKEKRKTFDFLIQGRRCEADNIFEAIEFELKLLEDVQNRRVITSIYDNQYEIEFDVVKRAVDVFNSMVAYGDESRIAQSTTLERYQFRIGICLQRICQRLPNSELAWSLTARWYIDQRAYTEARNFLYKGLNYNCLSQLLFYELFYLEIEIETRSSSKSKNFGRAKSVLDTILNHFLKNETDTEFAFKLLNLVELYGSVTAIFRNYMCKAMKDKFGHLEDFWNSLALVELKEKEYNPPDEHSHLITLPEKIKGENCIAVYKEGIQKVPTPLMWKYFLSALLSKPYFDDKVRYLNLMDAFRLSQTKKEIYMEEYHILKLADLTHASMQDKEEIYKWATQHLPKSEKLWSEYMQLFSDGLHQEKMEEIFAKGIQALEEKALPLWQQKLRYYRNQRTGDQDQLHEIIRHIYLNGVVNQPREVVEALQLQFLDWLVFEKGVPAARKAYLSFSKEALTLECHYKILEYELGSENANKEVVQGILGIACKMYGKTEEDCWIRYVEHCLKHDPSRVESVYAEALRTLEPNRHSLFIAQYRLLLPRKDTR